MKRILFYTSLLGLIFVNKCKAQDYQKFPQYIQEVKHLANSGDPDAIGIQSAFMSAGFIPGSVNDVVKYAQDSSDKGSAIGKYNLGVLYLQGFGLQKDENKGNKLILESLPGLEDLADKGNLYSQKILGSIYLNGSYGIEKNQTKGIDFLQKAANKRYARAELALSECYANGDGVLQNDEKSKQWLNKAADDGDPTAQLTIADKLYNWAGYESNEQSGKWNQVSRESIKVAISQALELYNKAYSTIKSPAVELIICGINIDSDKTSNAEKQKLLQKIVDIIKQEANGGSITQELNLGKAYSEGVLKTGGREINVGKSPDVSVKYYSMAATNGSSEAAYMLGQLYSDGNGVEESRGKAVEWYNKAVINATLTKVQQIVSPTIDGPCAATGGASPEDYYAQKSADILKQMGETETITKVENQKNEKESKQLDENRKATLSAIQDEESGKNGGPSTAEVSKAMGFDTGLIAYKSIIIKRGQTLQALPGNKIPAGTEIFPIKLYVDGIVIIFNLYKDTFGEWQADRVNQ